MGAKAEGAVESVDPLQSMGEVTKEGGEIVAEAEAAFNSEQIYRIGLAGTVLWHLGWIW